jgi:predicted RNA-binding protein with TRAM domain
VLEWQERTAFLLLVAVCLVVAGAHLVLTGIGKSAFASPFTPDSPDGDLVSLQGNVEDVTVTEAGGHMILRVEGIAVFVPSSARGDIVILKGDRVAVIGTVQTYRGEKEIVVQGRGDIRILS